MFLKQFKTASKGIIRKECQSFTNHGHDKTPPTVFNPPSLWLILSLNMGVSHTLWPPSISRATLACLRFARVSRQIKTAPKGIIRKECQSFTNHGHDKTPPTVFNPPSLWLTLSLNMGVNHTLWPPSITRAILACLWFAQGLYGIKKIKTAESYLRACGLHRVCTGNQKIKTAEPLGPAV